MRVACSLTLSLLIALASSASAFAEDFNITAEEHAACDADAIRFCMSAYPNVDRMIGCMVKNRNRLTAVCLKTFDEGMRRRNIPMVSLSASR